jgi:mannosyltransferase
MPCPFPALKGLLAAADFVVVPLQAARHACGYAAIADAMAMGKAVIATRTEHSSDLVVDGVTGLYVRPNDAEGLTGAIEQLLRDAALARRMGAAGRQRVESLFSLEAYVARIEGAIYRTT